MFYQWINKIHGRWLGVLAMLICSPLLSAAEETIEKTEQPLAHSSAEQMLKMVLGLMFVLALIFLLAWLMRRYGAMGLGGNRALRVIAGASVGQKERVVLLQVGERQILLGVTSSQVNMLHTLEKGEELDLSQNDTSLATPFAEKLKASLSKLEKK